MRLGRWLPVLALLAIPQVRSVADVPVGDLLWIQGYDGNPPMAGFAVFGTLRIEAVDDSQPVGINLNSGAITNTPGGLIVVNEGAGGPRFLNGSVFNEGTFEVNENLTFGGDNSIFRNTATFSAAADAPVEFRGRNGRLELVTGNFIAAGGLTVRDGMIAYDGGRLSGKATLFRSQIRVAPVVTNALEVDFGGSGCRFDGAITVDRKLTVWGGDGGVGAALELAGQRVSRGTVALSSRGSAFESWLTLPSGGWTNATGGKLQTLVGTGGLRRIFGNLKNEGEWTCTAGVLFGSQTAPVVNSGAVNLTFSGTINSPAGYRQLAGSTVLLGGSIYCPTNEVTLSAGTFEGGGRIYGRLYNDSRIIQKQWQGPLRVDGDYRQTVDGELSITLNAASTNAILNITNVATLQGSLEVIHADPAVVQPGDRFILLKAGAIEGWFDDIRLPVLRAGLFWEVTRAEEGDEEEIRLTAAEEPQTLVMSVEQFATEGVLEVSGAVAPGLRVEFSTDLANWTPVANPRPFPAYLKIEGLFPPASSSFGFFRVSLEE